MNSWGYSNSWWWLFEAGSNTKGSSCDFAATLVHMPFHRKIFSFFLLDLWGDSPLTHRLPTNASTEAKSTQGIDCKGFDSSRTFAFSFECVNVCMYVWVYEWVRMCVCVRVFEKNTVRQSKQTPQCISYTHMNKIQTSNISTHNVQPHISHVW